MEFWHLVGSVQGGFDKKGGGVECTRRIIQFREIMSNTQQTIGSPFSIDLCP